ncbi:transposase-like protein [Microbacterium halimionae]|uniref:Transposase-like protein n=1 Tax=Microbacterium halimionae TaxID=1526413 RepID=A0A7W3PL84_9MICO|nr:hypothetical protein [Microbacterium halimionae]MBA8815726.1 transposase-like protein [Microbacterium halimionae]NII95772.1 transposase-like protein [Microbacterium halimionae]
MLVRYLGEFRADAVASRRQIGVAIEQIATQAFISARIIFTTAAVSRPS